MPPATLIAVVAGLVIVVAAASTAARPETGPSTSANPRWVLDIAGSIAAVLGVFAIAVLVAGLRPGRRHLDDPDAESSRRRSWERILGIVVGWVCLALISSVLLGHGHLHRGSTGGAPRPGVGPLVPPTDTAQPPPQRVFDPWVAGAAAAATVFIGAAFGLALWWRGRPRRRVAGHEAQDPAPTAGAMVDESLAAIAAEADPRRAVIAAYASMERWLRQAGVPPEPWEAPFEYLDRVLVTVGAKATTAATLTGLFEDARFGPHPVSTDRRDEAVAALAALRAELAPVP